MHKILSLMVVFTMPILPATKQLSKVHQGYVQEIEAVKRLMLHKDEIGQLSRTAPSMFKDLTARIADMFLNFTVPEDHQVLADPAYPSQCTAIHYTLPIEPGTMQASKISVTATFVPSHLGIPKLIEKELAVHISPHEFVQILVRPRPTNYGLQRLQMCRVTRP